MYALFMNAVVVPGAQALSLLLQRDKNIVIN